MRFGDTVRRCGEVVRKLDAFRSLEPFLELGGELMLFFWNGGGVAADR